MSEKENKKENQTKKDKEERDSDEQQQQQQQQQEEQQEFVETEEMDSNASDQEIKQDVESDDVNDNLVETNQLKQEMVNDENKANENHEANEVHINHQIKAEMNETEKKEEEQSKDVEQEEEKEKSVELDQEVERQSAVYPNRDSNGRLQKWRKKMNVNEQNEIEAEPEQESENGAKIATTSTTATTNGNDDNRNDVWFSSQYEPVTLNDIMNDESQKLINKYENTDNLNNNKQKFVRNTHNFPLPFNKMVQKNSLYIEKPKCEAFNGLLIKNNHKQSKKIQKLIHKLSSNKKNYHDMNPKEQLKKTQLKQQKAERRRLQLREQRNNKWQIVAAKKKQKREELRKQTEHKLALQKQELNNKLISAKERYEKKMKEKKRRAKEYDEKIKHKAKEKDDELSKKREIQRKSQEEKMKNASQRYKDKISKKKHDQNVKNSNQNIQKKQKDQELNNSLALKKEKLFQKLQESENRRNEILKQIQQKSSEKEDKKQTVLQRKKQIEYKKKNNLSQKRRNKQRNNNNTNNNNNNNNKKKHHIQSSSSSQQNRKCKTPTSDSCIGSASTSSEFSFFSSEAEEAINNIDEKEMKETLQILLKSSNEYINGIKPKREWIGNCPYSELKSLIQSLCTKTNRLYSKLNTDKTTESILISMFNNDEERVEEDSFEGQISIESPLQNILKLMDCRDYILSDASSTYLLMYLVNDMVELIPYLNKLSLRTQRLLLQCIVNATQKNRGVAHYIIRSNSCLYLLHLLIQQISENQSPEIDSIIHTLTIAINSIRDFPDLMDRKIFFYKYVSILKFFNKIVYLFGRIVNRCTIPLNKNYHLFLRIVPFIQAITAFNTNDFDDSQLLQQKVIFDIIRDTNFYGLQSLISTLVLESNENNKYHSWRKSKPLIILRIVLHSFQTINNIARINLQSFQQIIDGMQIELYHVLSYLLSYLTFHFPTKNTMNTNHNNHIGDNNNNKHIELYNNPYFIYRALLNQVISFMSYCCLNNLKFQECFRWGDNKNNLINKLCQLPFDYFNKYEQMQILFPTLITCTFKNEANCKVLNTVLNKKHLIRFIIKTYHKKYNGNNDETVSCELEKRFPIKLWRSAIQFYRE